MKPYEPKIEYINNKKNKTQILDNLKIRRRYIKINKDKYNKIYSIYFYIFIICKIFILQFIKCNNRKIELASSYIKLKTNGTGQIKILNDIFFNKYKPNIIIINNKNNNTNDDINYEL